jgi:LIVCS family branched-chain amino acid:cation transporter
MISPVLFSALSCVIIYLFTYKKSRTLELLGKFLTPLLIIALCAIVTVGFITEGTPSINSMAKADLFLHGLKEGYNTMDLLAAFFFSSTVLSFLKSRFSSNDSNPSNPIHISLQASLIGAVLLSLTYIGFSMIAAIHGNDVSVTSKDELLSAMILKIVGPSANLLVSITVGLACLTTAIALISVFSDFAHREVFKEKVSYRATLIGSLLITFCISTLEFEGISKMLGPILEICYPGLIVLTLLNILYRTTGFKIVKTPVFLTFLASAWVYFK